jgi:hypothetical protein
MMTNMQPVGIKPMPPLKVGETVSVKLLMVNKNGKDGVGKLNGTWLIEVNHATDKAALVPESTIDVMITKLFPGGAQATQI